MYKYELWTVRFLREIYLDNSATTRVSEKALDKAVEMMKTKYGNPSSLHKKGLEAELEIEKAREIIAESLGANESDIYFTSGSTESNNMILFGVSQRKRKQGTKIIVSSVEHSSVLDSAKRLEELGFNVHFIPVNKDGKIDKEALIKEIDDKTTLVSVMMVNNETGAINDIKEISKTVKKKNDRCLFHCDAVQAFGKVKINIKNMDVDFLTVSSHKVHGPKNCGAIYIKNRSSLFPLLYGGEQQKRIRPGTEMSSIIPSFGVAVSEFDIDNNYEYIKKINERLRTKIKDNENIIINSPDDALPYIINISVKGIRSETMLHFLESKNIFISSGSACGKGKKSYVLKAMGIDNDIIDSALRISFSKYNKEEDIDTLIDALSEGIESLSKKR